MVGLLIDMRELILEEKKNELYESILTESNRLEKLINNWRLIRVVGYGLCFLTHNT